MQVSTARKKLAGEHPTAVLISELTPRHAGTKYWASLQVRLVLALSCSMTPTRVILAATEQNLLCYTASRVLGQKATQ